MTDKDITETLGQQVFDNKPLACPVCQDEWDDEATQHLSSFGDDRSVLFCPHCDMCVTLVIER